MALPVIWSWFSARKERSKADLRTACYTKYAGISISVITSDGRHLMSIAKLED